MAYAHWEGFAKSALVAYLGYLRDTRHIVGTLQQGLRALSAISAAGVSASESSLDFSRIMRLVEALDDRDSAIFSVNPGKLVRTGNLNSAKLKSLLAMCSLDYLNEYSTREKFIDEVLCGRRHRIAHGELVPISDADLREAVDGVLDLCGRINDQVVETILDGKYLLGAAP
jgi:hypothetical protein